MNSMKKTYTITEEQIRDLFLTFTRCGTHSMKLIISSESHSYSNEAQEARDDYEFNECNTEEYEKLQKQCNNNEIVTSVQKIFHKTFVYY